MSRLFESYFCHDISGKPEEFSEHSASFSQTRNGAREANKAYHYAREICVFRPKFLHFEGKNFLEEGFTVLSSTSLAKLYLTGLALFPVDQIMRLFQTRNLKDRGWRDHIPVLTGEEVGTERILIG